MDNCSGVDESENTNMETNKMFSCYFPDRSTNTTAGGFDSPEAFKEFVEELQSSDCHDMEFQCNLEKRFVSCGDMDEFTHTSVVITISLWRWWHPRTKIKE